MPPIDMRRGLTNPRTLDVFNVLRRKQIVSDEGRISVETTPFPDIRGVVTPNLSMKDLQRLSDEQLQGKAISITTQFALRGTSETVDQQNFQPDIVFWHGNNFVIVFVEDYSNYAAGFVKAIGIMMDLNAVPEVTNAQ
jgi:hypothetical protein